LAIPKPRLVIILALFFAGTLLTKVYLNSASEFRVARELQSSGKIDEALTHYELAFRWYLPFSPYPPESLKAMWEVGERFQREGEAALALETYRSVRGAIQGVRSFYTPYRGWLERANDRIAALEAALKPYPEVESSSFAERKEEALAMLELDRAPSVGWSLITEAGFVGWVLCAIGLALSMNSGSRVNKRRTAFFWGLLLTLSFAFWLVGMAHA
jgi:tetratricopeptide (TPR) repeat protein